MVLLVLLFVSILVVYFYFVKYPANRQTVSSKMVNEKKIELRPYSMVKDLNPNRVDWRISVLCCRRWVVPANRKRNIPFTLEFLFVDSQGDRIQATVSFNLFEKFNSTVEAGAEYSITQFSVRENKGDFPVTDNAYRIWFHPDTFVVPRLVRRSFPNTIYKFKSFQDIKSGGHFDDNALFDVIGYIDSNEGVDVYANGGKRSIEVTLRDLEKKSLKCTLWESVASEFQEGYAKRSDGFYVVILQLCKTKLLRGEIALSSTYPATKLILNNNVEEIVEFKNRLQAVEEPFWHALSDHGLPVVEESYKGVVYDVENLNVLVVTLNQIKECENPGKFWVAATISEVVSEKGWCYNSCAKCRQKVVEGDDMYFCENCHEFVVAVPRFNIHVKVVDGYSLEFLLIGHVAFALVGKSAADIIQRLEVGSKVKDGDLIPADVEYLEGKEVLFRVQVERRQIGKKNCVYVVDRICGNGKLIKHYKASDHQQTVALSSHTQLLSEKEDWLSEGEEDFVDTISESSNTDVDVEEQSNDGAGGSSQQLSLNKKRRLANAVDED